ncbi:MAG: hypothetical protein OES18_24415 [Deltaproteobacteria bacterium]|nr:hypothetical protein [Deltaproteobacteria bacterium]
MFLRQAPRDYARDRKDRLPLRRTFQVRLGCEFLRLADGKAIFPVSRHHLMNNAG